MRSLILGLLLAGLSLPAAADTLSYLVLKEGEPIGHETVTVTRDGQSTRVHVATETRVKVLFLDFHFTHQRDETWTGTRLQRLVSDTDDDGEIHHLEGRADDRSMKLEVDGKPRELPADSLPLTLWTKAILDCRLLYSVIDATPYPVTITDLGPDRLILAGRQVATEHYRIAGGVARELWYGADGQLLKTAFERRGYPIEVVRE